MYKEIFSIYRKTVKICSLYYIVTNYASSLNHANMAQLSEVGAWGGKEH
jgi:hypothetical protein